MANKHNGRLATLSALLCIVVCCCVASAQNAVTPPIKTEKIVDGVYVLRGSGANITVSVGEDGALLVDDGLPQLVDKVRAAVAAITPRPIRLVVNTNWHFDHADGNELLSQTGAIVIAHEKSRGHMLVEQRIPEYDPDVRIPPYQQGALPVVTCRESLTIHFNGEEIKAEHVPDAHSDGDLLLHFQKSNVLHTGDLFFPNAIPFINFSGGGSIEGMIRAAERILKASDEGTRIIPGHGPTSTRDDVRAARDLLVTVRERLVRLHDEGKTVDEVVAANPLADLYVGRRSHFKVENLTRYGFLDIARGHESSR